MFRKFTGPLLVISGFLVSLNSAQEAVDCSNSESVTIVFNDPIDLIYTGDIRIYTDVLINNIISTTNNEFDKNYIDARLEEQPNNGTQSLIIFTTEHFPNYAKEQSASRITLRVNIGCDSGRQRTLIFYQPFEEGNYYRPEFSQEVYEFHLPMPLFAGFDLTTFGMISAKDDDLTGNEIHFTSTESGKHFINVSTKSEMGEDRKTYYAQLTLDRIYLALATEIQFNITATDSGTPPLNSTALVIMRPDPANTIPMTPHFEQLVYHAELNGSLQMAPFVVTLKNETYNADVSFEKLGTDAQLFELDNTANVVKVRLAAALAESDVQYKKFLQFEIKANNHKLTEFGQTAVIVAIPNAKESFRFVSPLYEGFIDANAELSIPNIVFNEAAFDAAINFTLSSKEEEQLFRLVQNLNTLELQLSEDFKLEDWKNQSYFTLEINATLNDQNDRTAIFIRLPEVDVPKPIFESQFYFGKLNENAELSIAEQVQLNETTYIRNKTQYKLIADQTTADLFQIIENEHRVQLQLKRAPSREELESHFAFALMIAAINDDLEGLTSIIIESPATETTNFGDVFKSAWYSGRIELSTDGTPEPGQVLHVPKIFLGPEHQVGGFIYELLGDESKYFSTSLNEENVIALQLVESIPDAIFQAKTQINLKLNALNIKTNEINGSTLLFIELPRPDCSNVQTNPSLSDTPHFDNDFYIFAAKPNQLGSIGTVNAIVDNLKNVSILYTLNVENDHLAPRITINVNTGELQLLSYVSPGIYHFEISAQNVHSFSKSKVLGRLDVESLIQCDAGQINVANTLIIKYIEEEKAHTDIMAMSMGDCEYKLFSMFPNDKAYVSIDENTKMLTSMKIDREDPTFENMTKPQIQIKLKLLCSNATVLDTRIRRDVATDKYSPILSQDIPYARDITWLHLVLIDINDNAPRFTYPLKPTRIGYPEGEICLELFPEYLTQVHAHDIDEDLNAKIRYTLRTTDEDKYFDIDDVSGIIYPTANALQMLNSTTLYVRATDRDGATDGLSSEAIFYVKRLSSEYFALLTLRSSNEWQNLSNQLQELGKEISYEINSVKMATLPGAVTDLRLRRPRAIEDSTIIQKVWIYAFEGDTAVNSELFKQRLAGISDAEKFYTSAETYKEIGLMSNQTFKPNLLAPNEEDLSGYIAAVSVLSVALFILLGFILWYFYLKEFYENHRKSAARKFDNESTLPPTPIAENKKDTQDDIGYVRHYFNDNSEPEDFLRRSSLTFSDITLQETNKQFIQPSASEAKLGVKFNELVERIHIDVPELEFEREQTYTNREEETKHL